MIPILTQNGEGGDLIKEIYEVTQDFPLVEKSFQLETTGYLYTVRCIADAVDIDALLSTITPTTVSRISDATKDALRYHFLKLFHRQCPTISEDQKIRFRSLPIFKVFIIGHTMLSKLLYGSVAVSLIIRTEYVSLNRIDSLYVPVRGVSVLPVVQGVRFLDATDERDRQLLDELGYVELTVQDILRIFVLPNIKTQPIYLLDSLIQLIFDNAVVNDVWVKELETVEFITVSGKDGSDSSLRLKGSQVIDKSAPIAELFFDSEECFGNGIYSAGGRYHQQMVMLGMKSYLDAEMADSRIRKYVSLPPDAELFQKSVLLLKYLNVSVFEFRSEWLSLLKLPAMKDGEGECVLPISECRPENCRYLVDGVLGIVSTYVSPTLQKAFKWMEPLEATTMGLRICKIAASSNSGSSIENALYRVLEYINTLMGVLGDKFEDYIATMKSQILNKPVFPGSCDGLWSCEHLFLQDARKFEPYLSNVPRSYVEPFRRLLELLGVITNPSPECLVKLMSMLQSDTPLSRKDMDISINILERLSKYDMPESELFVPDLDQRLVSISKLKASLGSPTCIYAHPRVPASFAFKYGIPQQDSSLAFLQHISFSDVLDDYCQEEQVSTMINNTLKDYSLWTAFNEFTANAEDCGTATTVSWLLDREDEIFPRNNLFSPELKAWQTPALYVYNDGIFSEADYKAFINIGRGSKAKDSSKIGKYGRGSLTMYHFTDVPSMISGEYFVIFDPSRRFLPLLPNGHRRAGMRVPLTLMRLHYQDHLIPFIGIGGFSLGNYILSQI